MKELFVIILTLFSFNSSAQVMSDLYHHVDSVVQYELHYVYDSTNDKSIVHDPDTSKVQIINYSSPNNPSPLILLDGKPIKLANLNDYKKSEIATIEVFGKNEIKMQALYGTSARNGVIMIHTKEYNSKKH